MKNSQEEYQASSRITFLIGFLFIAFIAAVTISGLPIVWENVTGQIGPITIGSRDPKNPHAVIPAWGVITILIALTILSGILYFIRNNKDEAALKRDKARREMEGNKRVEAANLLLAETDVLSAALEARRAAFDEEMNAERERVREVVELEWQRDKKAEIERAHSQYLSYLERDRTTKAQYEAAVLQRQHHIAQLEEFVLDTYPAFKVENDPINQKAPAVLAALFRKKVVKSRKNDAGLLRYSTNQEVLMKLGDMTDLPPSPPRIAEPIYIPMPEALRRRFEGQQVQNSQRVIDH